MQRSWYRVFVIMWVASALGGCADAPPEFSATLSDPGELPYDQQLNGSWYGDGGDFLMVTSLDAYSLAAAYVIPLPPDNDHKMTVLWYNIVAYPSELEGKIYFNVGRRPGVGDDYTEPGLTPGNMIMRADLTADDRLSLRQMDASKLRQRVEDGRLEGYHASEKELKPGYIWINITRDKLRALIREIPDEELFTKPVLYRRLTPLPNSEGTQPG